MILCLNEMKFCVFASEPLEIVLQASWRQTEYSGKKQQRFLTVDLSVCCFLEQSCFLFWLLAIFVLKNSHFCVVSQSQLEMDTDVLT